MNHVVAAARAGKVEFPILTVLPQRPCLAYAPPENKALSGYIA